MPIEIKAVPLADYLAWVKVAQANYTENTFAAAAPFFAPAHQPARGCTPSPLAH